MNLTPSRLRLYVRLAAQLVAAITAIAVSHPAWAGAVGTLTAIEAILQVFVKETAGDGGSTDGEDA